MGILMGVLMGVLNDVKKGIETSPIMQFKKTLKTKKCLKTTR